MKKESQSQLKNFLLLPLKLRKQINAQILEPGQKRKKNKLTESRKKFEKIANSKKI